MNNLDDWVNFKENFKDYKRKISGQRKQQNRKEIVAIWRIIRAIDKSEGDWAEASECEKIRNQQLHGKLHWRVEKYLKGMTEQSYLNERNFNTIFQKIKKEEKKKKGKNPDKDT